MKNKCICINNKGEIFSIENFNLWQTYEYETGMVTCGDEPGDKAYYIYLDENQWTQLFEEDFDQHFMDLAIYRNNQIINILK